MSDHTTLRLRRWAHLTALNLLLVSLLGAILRYKGAFPLPFVNYKYLLNAHSHFAFAGWVTTALFTAFLYILKESGIPLHRTYQFQFILSQLSSFGMLISFTVQGYGPVSIVFSSLSVVFSYWFAIRYWLDSKKTSWPPLVKSLIRAALIFLVLSSAGPFLLAYSMSHAIGNSAFYYNAIYLYLHFQYNGWFTFGVLTLFFWWAHRSQLFLSPKLSKTSLYLLVSACIPAYCLSLLWTDPPLWIKATAAIAGTLQLIALVLLIIALRRRPALPRHTRILWLLSLAAFSIKLLLQALSVIPRLGQLAFGYRPVIIAYLHLVVLGFITFLLLGFFLSEGLLRIKQTGLYLFASGVILNEVILLLQSLLAFASSSWMTAPYYLFAAALLMLTGLTITIPNNFIKR